MKNQVVLVDTSGHPTGTIDKMAAHQCGLLHQAVSVLIFNSRQEWLLQRRAPFKYHSPGLWSNTCCTHPYPGETPEAAAKRRLTEEMGLHCPLTELYRFTYQACLGTGMTEHEYDHVFIGYTDKLPAVNPDEVSDWCYLSSAFLQDDRQNHPEKYTIWFQYIFQELLHLNFNNV